MELIGIYFIACGLLVLAGAAKAVRPDDTARAIVFLLPHRLTRILSFNVTRRVVRTGALLEATLGASALVLSRALTAWPVTASYLLFTGIVIYARRRGGPVSTCGCFGRPDTPATALHIVLNVVFVITGLVVAIQAPHHIGPASLIGSQPWDGVPLLLASGVGVWLAYLTLSPLAALEASRRPVIRSRREAANT